MDKSITYEEIDQLLAEVDDLLDQIDSEILDYLEEDQRAELEQQAQSLRELRSGLQDKIGEEEPRHATSYSEGMHEAMEDIVKAMKALAGYLS
jgi:DNA repair exonuclease SbcCD ATPase subunit